MILRNGGKAIKEHSIQCAAFHGVTPLPAIRDKEPLQAGVKASHRKQQPCNSGAFYLKGCDMKKYYPVDFDEKGNAVLGNAKSNPTSNGFIPTTWAPGGGSDDGSGIKSITISPAITTTPALESLFPIYWEDMTEKERQEGRAIKTTTTVDLSVGVEYTFTITPTADWYMADMTGGAPTFGGEGDPITVKRTVTEYGGLYFEVVACETNQPNEASKVAPITFAIEQAE